MYVILITLQELLKDVNELLYVDTDTLFLRSLDDLWAFFNVMNSSHIASLTPEQEDAAIGWYNRFARHPYYGKLGEITNGGLFVFMFLKNLVNIYYGWGHVFKASVMINQKIISYL